MYTQSNIDQKQLLCHILIDFNTTIVAYNVNILNVTYLFSRIFLRYMHIYQHSSLQYHCQAVLFICLC